MRRTRHALDRRPRKGQAVAVTACVSVMAINDCLAQWGAEAVSGFGVALDASGVL